MTTYTFQERTVTLPVEVRDASSWSVQYLVPAEAAQSLIGHTGLTIAHPVPGRAMMSLVFVHYRDSDLDSYNEVGIGFLVREHDAPPAGTARTALHLMRQRDLGIYIHHLPVNQTFTLEAGRGIWGYPKFLADITIDEHPGFALCTLVHEGRKALTVSVRGDGRIPMPMPTPPTYTFLDGVLRRTTFEIPPTKAAGRLGGARIELGDHPIADELRSLGLPKRAVSSQFVRTMRARFAEPEIVQAAEPVR